MLDDGDAGHLDGAGAAPVGEPGGTRRGPAAHKPTAKPAKKQSPAPVGSISCAGKAATRCSNVADKTVHPRAPSTMQGSA